MAEKEKEKENKADKTDAAPQAGSKTGVLTWVIMVTVITALSGSGFVLGHLLAGSSSPESAPSDAVVPATPESKPSSESPPSETKKGEAPKSKHGEAASATSESKTIPGGVWYYNDLESVVVNPNEPGATRFIRVGLILEMREGSEPEKTKELIDTKKPLLINWLNLYFKGLTLNEMQNERGLNRLLTQICDGFNEILSPEAKPMIKKILIREFNIQ